MEVLCEHVNAAVQRALRPGSYVSSAHFCGSQSATGTRSAILVLGSDALAEAVLGMHEALLCQGHRLAIRRPQGWGAAEQRAVEALPQIRLAITREEAGVELPAILSVEERLRAVRIARAKEAGALGQVPWGGECAVAVPGS